MSVRMIARLVAAIPPQGAAIAGSIAGPMMALLAPSRARAWRSNHGLTGADRSGRRLPSATPFRHHILLQYESLAMLGGRAFPIEVEGSDHAREALTRARGLLVATAHVGNWHLGGEALHRLCGRPIHSVAGAQMLRSWTEELRSLYGARGIQIHDRSGAVGRLLRILRTGGIVALHLDGDQHEGRGLATRGISLLSRRSGAPVLPVLCIRSAAGRMVLRIWPPLGGGSTAPSPDRLADLLVELVRGREGQWTLFRALGDAA
ncbi:MAG: lysophospholipid acyltransferase family protein [Candidatus Eisenbacteria bacterium]|nr:lysophospholipid acyltransferase family protein [Candidatus Eisenbacteria bacterium]